VEKKVKYNCLRSLREVGSPVIIVAAVLQAEAIINACRNTGIAVSAFCDTDKRKSQDSTSDCLAFSQAFGIRMYQKGKGNTSDKTKMIF